MFFGIQKNIQPTGDGFLDHLTTLILTTGGAFSTAGELRNKIPVK